MSSVVAVAGGTGGLGRTIVEAIVADGKHKVFIFSRKANDELEKQIGAKILPVDYANVDSIKRILEENAIDTIISTMNFQGIPQTEHNLIAAAEQSATTRRYVPSIWGVVYPLEPGETFPAPKDKGAVLAALQGTNLEYTYWLNGYFSDYFVSPPLKSYMHIFPAYVDVAHGAAGIPGSGDVPVNFTHTLDVAQFVSASLSLPKWERETLISGDTLTLKQLVQTIEEAKKKKFQVTYDSVEDLKAGKVTELPGHPAYYSIYPKKEFQVIFAFIGLWMERGLFNITRGHPIAKDFPDLHARSIKELLEEGEKAT